MTKRKYRIYSYLFLFFSIVFLGFLIKAIFAEVGVKRVIFSVTFGVLVIMQLRLALLLYRKSQNLELK